MQLVRLSLKLYAILSSSGSHHRSVYAAVIERAFLRTVSYHVCTRAVQLAACHFCDALTAVAGVRRFFTFMLLLFLLHSMGLGMFRVIASLCRDETISSTGGAFFFLTLLLLGGFLLPRSACLRLVVLLQPHTIRCERCYMLAYTFACVVHVCMVFIQTADQSGGRQDLTITIMWALDSPVALVLTGWDMPAQTTSIRGGSGSTGSTPCPTRPKVRSSTLSAVGVFARQAYESGVTLFLLLSRRRQKCLRSLALHSRLDRLIWARLGPVFLSDVLFLTDLISGGHTAIAINEYRAPRWAEVTDSSGQPAYITLLQSHGSHTDQWWIWLGVVWVIIGWAVFNIMTWFNHSFLNRALAKVEAYLYAQSATGMQAVMLVLPDPLAKKLIRSS